MKKIFFILLVIMLGCTNSSLKTSAIPNPDEVTTLQMLSSVDSTCYYISTSSDQIFLINDGKAVYKLTATGPFLLHMSTFILILIVVVVFIVGVYIGVMMCIDY